MNAPHHQTFRGNEASDGAGLGARYSLQTLRAEIFPTVREFAREVGIAVSVSLGVAAAVGIIVVSRAAFVSLNL